MKKPPGIKISDGFLFVISVEFWVLPLTAHRSLLPFDFFLP